MLLLEHHWPLGKESQLFTELRAQPDMQVWRFLPRSTMPPGKTKMNFGYFSKEVYQKTAFLLSFFNNKLCTMGATNPYACFLCPPKLGWETKSPCYQGTASCMGFTCLGVCTNDPACWPGNLPIFHGRFFSVQTPVNRLRQLCLCLAGHSC